MYTLGTAANNTTANKVTDKNILNFDFNDSNIRIIQIKHIFNKNVLTKLREFIKKGMNNIKADPYIIDYIWLNVIKTIL